MNRTRWNTLKQAFGAVYDLPAAQRGGALQDLERHDPELRRAVEALIVSSEAGAFLDNPPGATEAPDEPAARIGQRVGGYELCRVLGSGGMGVVYLARRADGQFHHQAAIKLIHAHHAGGELKRRFLLERQMLATLHHPNIVRLLDGGVTSEGLLYLVMEFVDGQPIDLYCDELHLTIDQRLELFRVVCGAVQYAHQNLVIHRDLKPGNILVSRDGAVKLLDFGIAKLHQPSPLQTTSPALPRPMTLEYASPEQIRGEPITTASDVYSAGVVLYRLLTGRSPYPAPLSAHELEHRICEVDVERPSAAIRRGGSSNGTAPSQAAHVREIARIQRRLRGDLDHILLKALAREPQRRYSSMEHFSEDLRRHLAGLPVSAGHGTLSYRARKFARRHKAWLAAACLALCALLAGTAGTTWQALRAARERDAALAAQHSARIEAERARRAALRAERINTLLQRMLSSIDPANALGRDITVREVLDRTAGSIHEELAGEPLLEADLQTTLGLAYLGLGLYEPAEQRLQQALTLRRAHLGGGHLETAKSLNNLGTVLYAQAKYDEAEHCCREAIGALDRGIDEGPELAQALNNLAAVHAVTGDPRAAALYRRALAMRVSLFGRQHLDVAETLNNIAGLLSRQGQRDSAELLIREVRATRGALLGDDHPDFAQSLNNLAVLLVYRGAHAEAEALYRESLAVFRGLGDSRPGFTRTLANLAALLPLRGDSEAAERLAPEVLSRIRTCFGEDHPALANQLWNTGSMHLRRGRPAQAERLLRECIRIRRLHFPGHWSSMEAANLLGECLAAQGRFDEAEPVLRESHAALRDALGPDHPKTRAADQAMAQFHRLTGRQNSVADHDSP